VTLLNSDVDWAKIFQRCRSAHLKLLYLFKILFCVKQGYHQWWPWHKISISIDCQRWRDSISLSTTVPRLSDIVRRKHAQKSHWVTDWLKLFVIFQQKKNLNMDLYSFFQTFCPLTHWYAGSYETVFRYSTKDIKNSRNIWSSLKSRISRIPARVLDIPDFNSGNHFLPKVLMLSCKSVLLKFHPRDW